MKTQEQRIAELETNLQYVNKTNTVIVEIFKEVLNKLNKLQVTNNLLKNRLARLEEHSHTHTKLCDPASAWPFPKNK
jgi:uncharacterized coiled-coil protein SlyX